MVIGIDTGRDVPAVDILVIAMPGVDPFDISELFSMVGVVIVDGKEPMGRGVLGAVRTGFGMNGCLCTIFFSLCE